MSLEEIVHSRSQASKITNRLTMKYVLYMHVHELLSRNTSCGAESQPFRVVIFKMGVQLYTKNKLICFQPNK